MSVLQEAFSLDKQEPTVVKWHTSRSGGILSQYSTQHSPVPVFRYIDVLKLLNKLTDYTIVLFICLFKVKLLFEKGGGGTGAAWGLNSVREV